MKIIDLLSKDFFFFFFKVFLSGFYFKCTIRKSNPHRSYISNPIKVKFRRKKSYILNILITP